MTSPGVSTGARPAGTEPPAWMRVVAFPSSEQLDAFAQEITDTASVAEHELAKARAVRANGQGALAAADAYHETVQERMTQRKKRLAEREMRAARLGKQR